MANYRKAVRISLPEAKFERSIGDKFRHLEIESLECEIISPNLINVKLVARKDNQIFVEELTHITHQGDFTVWWQQDTRCFSCDKEAIGICECGRAVCKLHSKVVKGQIFCKQCAKLSEEEEFQAFWQFFEHLTTLLVKKTPLEMCVVCQQQAFVGGGELFSKYKFNDVDLEWVIGGAKYEEFDELYGVLTIANQNRFEREEGKFFEKLTGKRAWLFQESKCPNGCKVCNKKECTPEIVEQITDEKSTLIKYQCRGCRAIWESTQGI